MCEQKRALLGITWQDDESSTTRLKPRAQGDVYWAVKL